jgi:NADPH:quinone reductase-like Zn-dependent oxidoreductase
MKALIIEEYGSIEVLKFKDIPKPSPKNNEVLVKIKSTTVNRSDCGFRSGTPFVSKLFTGYPKPKKQILGSEFSGVIEECGNDVKNFKIGDEIFALSPNDLGSHAEYICIDANGFISKKAENYSFDQAAAVLDGLMLANNYIRDIDFKTIDNILINGATGSIGSACVQLAKYHGNIEITAVANTKNIDLIKSIGADYVIDYLNEDFTKIDKKFDVVLDAVGKSSFQKCRAILKEKGTYYSSELGESNENIYLPLITKFSKQKVKFPIPLDGKIDIEFYKKVIEEGKYKAIIDKTYSFDDIIEAYKYVETGEKTGNVVIKIS